MPNIVKCPKCEDSFHDGTAHVCPTYYTGLLIIAYTDKMGEVSLKDADGRDVEASLCSFVIDQKVLTEGDVETLSELYLKPAGMAIQSHAQLHAGLDPVAIFKERLRKLRLAAKEKENAAEIR